MNPIYKKLALPLAVALLAGCASTVATDSNLVAGKTEQNTCDDGGKDIQIYRIIADRMFDTRNPIINTIPKAEPYLLQGKTTINNQSVIDYGKDLIEVMEALPEQWDVEIVERMRCAGIFEENRKVIPADLRLIRDIFADNLAFVKSRYEAIEKIEQRNQAWIEHKTRHQDALLEEVDSATVLIDQIYIVNNIDAIVFDVAFDSTEISSCIENAILIDRSGKQLPLVSTISSPVRDNAGSRKGQAVVRYGFQGQPRIGDYKLSLSFKGEEDNSIEFDLPDGLLSDERMHVTFN